MNRLSLTGWAVIAVVLACGGLALGWWLYGPAPAKPETYAASERLENGSLVLERKPDATARAKTATPKGGRVERVIAVTVQPHAPASTPGVQPVLCPPVTVDMSVVRMPDDSRRVVASSPDGEVVGGVDIPVEPTAATAMPPKWAAGLSINPLEKTPGVFLDRDAGPFRVGVEVNKLSVGAGVDLRVKAGLRF